MMQASQVSLQKSTTLTKPAGRTVGMSTGSPGALSWTGFPGGGGAGAAGAAGGWQAQKVSESRTVIAANARGAGERRAMAAGQRTAVTRAREWHKGEAMA